MRRRLWPRRQRIREWEHHRRLPPFNSHGRWICAR
jgi:hypothetical protein